MFCSNAAYSGRQAFYTTVFGAPWEGPINEGAEHRSYRGSIWDRGDGFCFALLVNPDLTGSAEHLAHIGLIFNGGAEFDAEIRRRGIDVQQIKVLPAGQRQVFVPDEKVPGVEWEFTCLELIKS
jgi:hypothetical protein